MKQNKILGEIKREVKAAIKSGYIQRPTKELYPYDAATGWQDYNIARMKYYQLTGKKC